MKFSFEGPGDKKKLKETSVSEGGYPVYEWSENWSQREIQEFLKRMGTVVNKIAADDMSDEERKSVGDLSVAAMAGALAAASPNADVVPEEVDPIRIELTADNNQTVAKEAVADNTYHKGSEREQPLETGHFEEKIADKTHWLEKNMVSHFDLSMASAAQPVVGVENMSRMEYLGQGVHFESHSVWGDLPEAVQEELRFVLPALAVQESGYNNSLVSKDGALGILQLLPGTIIDMYGAQDWTKEEQAKLVRDVQLSLVKQVEVAGKYFVSMRYTIFDSERYGIGEKAKQELARRHRGDTETYEREFMTMMLVNGYNAGPARMGGIVREYFEDETHMNNGLAGRELFLDIIEWAHKSKEGMAAKFGDDAYNYVLKIYAVRNLMAARGISGQSSKDVTVTFNF
jgi:hypothetical protein